MTTLPPDPDAELRRPLSPREADVAALLGRGLDYQRIAVNLGLSMTRVEQLVRGIACKLPAYDDAVSGPMRARLWAGARHWWQLNHPPTPPTEARKSA